MGLVDRDDGWRMPDWLRKKIEPLLPPPPEHPLGTHKRGLPKRQVMDAILLVLRTGMQWNALDVTGVCNSSTPTGAFRNGSGQGVFQIWRQGLLDYDSEVGIDWSLAGGRRGDDKGAARRSQDRSDPQTEPRGGEALAPHGCRRNPDRTRPRRRQPQRPPPAEGDARLGPDRAPRPERGRSPGPLSGQGLRLPRLLRDLLEDRGFTPHIRARGEEIDLKRHHPVGRAHRWWSRRVTHGSTATAASSSAGPQEGPKPPRPYSSPAA